MKQKTRMFSFYIFLDLFEKAGKLAEKERISISRVINKALEKFFKNEKSL